MKTPKLNPAKIKACSGYPGLQLTIGTSLFLGTIYIMMLSSMMVYSHDMWSWAMHFCDAGGLCPYSMWPCAILSDGGALLGTSLAATDVLMIAMKLLVSLKHVAMGHT